MRYRIICPFLQTYFFIFSNQKPLASEATVRGVKQEIVRENIVEDIHIKQGTIYDPNE